MPTSREKSKLKHICDQRRLQGAVYFSQHAKHRNKMVRCVDRHGETTCFLNGTKLVNKKFGLALGRLEARQNFVSFLG